jgi:4-hydroxybenzoate polyprenyltransferase
MSSTASPPSATVLDYLQLCRVSNLPTTWVNTLAGCVLSGGTLSAAKVLLLVLGVSCMYCGGMAMNDCLDARIDAQRKPFRPIASGRISKARGTLACLALFGASMAAFRATGVLPFRAATVLLALVVLYNLCNKLSPLAVIPMAGCRSMIYVTAGLALSASLPLPLLALATLQFAYVMLLSVLARLEKGSTPVMLAGISLLDGLFLACAAGVGWMAAGLAGGAATLASQRRIRGD